MVSTNETAVKTSIFRDPPISLSQIFSNAEVFKTPAKPRENQVFNGISSVSPILDKCVYSNVVLGSLDKMS